MKKEKQYYLMSLLVIIILSVYPIYMGVITMLSYVKEGYIGVENYSEMSLDSWQYSLCIATPEVLEAIGEPIYAENNPAYKVHFYIIAIVILLAVLNTAFGFYNMILENNREREKPLIAQLVAVIWKR